MDIKNLENSIVSEVRTDAFDNEIRIGDVVFYNNGRISYGIIERFTPTGIKILNNPKLFYKNEMLKSNYRIPEEVINGLKNELEKVKNTKKIYKKALVFIYKSKSDDKKGIGVITNSGATDAVIKNKIKKIIDEQYKDYEFHFMKHEKIVNDFGEARYDLTFDEEPNNISSSVFLFNTNNNYYPLWIYEANYFRKYKNAILFFEYVDKEKAKRIFKNPMNIDIMEKNEIIDKKEDANEFNTNFVFKVPEFQKKIYPDSILYYNKFLKLNDEKYILAYNEYKNPDKETKEKMYRMSSRFTYSLAYEIAKCVSSRRSLKIFNEDQIKYSQESRYNACNKVMNCIFSSMGV